MPPKIDHARANATQLEMMVSYMETHTLFARGQVTALGRSGHLKYKKMWEKLTEKLNQLGYVKKKHQCWKRLRTNAKERKAAYLYSLQKTGNNSITPLNELDERITDVFGEYGTGMNIIPEIGVTEHKYVTPVNPIHKQLNTIHQRTLEIVKNFKQEVITSLLDLKYIIWIKRQNSQRVRSNKAQLQLLMSFMERNKSFAKAEVDADLYDEQWNELTKNLNAIGGENRSVEAWKRTWNDKVRLVKEKKRAAESGNSQLTEMDITLLKILDEDIPRKTQTDIYSPSTSKQQFGGTSSIPAKRRAGVDEGHTDIAKEAYNDLTRKLIECFDKQNSILEKGLTSITRKISKICTEIVQAFNLYREEQPFAVRPDEDSNEEQVNAQFVDHILEEGIDDEEDIVFEDIQYLE